MITLAFATLDKVRQKFFAILNYSLVARQFPFKACDGFRQYKHPTMLYLKNKVPCFI